MPVQRSPVDQYIAVHGQSYGKHKRKAEHRRQQRNRRSRKIALPFTADRQGLLAKWLDLFEAAAPPSFSRSLLRGGVIFKFQAWSPEQGPSL